MTRDRYRAASLALREDWTDTQVGFCLPQLYSLRARRPDMA